MSTSCVGQPAFDLKAPQLLVPHSRLPAQSSFLSQSPCPMHMLRQLSSFPSQSMLHGGAFGGDGGGDGVTYSRRESLKGMEVS